MMHTDANGKKTETTDHSIIKRSGAKYYGDLYAQRVDTQDPEVISARQKLYATITDKRDDNNQHTTDLSHAIN